MSQIIRDIIWLPSHRPSPMEIIRHVATRRELTVADLCGSSRVTKITHVRHEAMWELRNRTSLSLVQIAQRLGRSDHVTALNGIRQHDARMAARREAA